MGDRLRIIRFARRPTRSDVIQMTQLNDYRPDEPTQIEIFGRMALLRANDERTRKEVMNGRLVIPYYSYRGQEVIPAAMSVNLTDQDYLCTIYRGIHDMLAKGLPLKPVVGRNCWAC